MNLLLSLPSKIERDMLLFSLINTIKVFRQMDLVKRPLTLLSHFIKCTHGLDLSAFRSLREGSKEVKEARVSGCVTNVSGSNFSILKSSINSSLVSKRAVVTMKSLLEAVSSDDEEDPLSANDPYK